MFVFSIFIALWVKKKPIKIIPACSTHVWWWKLEVQPCCASFSIVCFSHCSIPVTILKFIYSPFQLIIFIMFLHFHSVVHSIYFKKLLPCPRRAECKSWAICAAFCGLKTCEILVLLLLSKENCLLCKRICILFSNLKFGRGKFAAGKFGGENIKQNMS